MTPDLSCGIGAPRRDEVIASSQIDARPERIWDLAPDLFGIPNHGVVVARGCFIGPCPPPKALIIDIEALPEAPPGSDADRIARGLPPLGRDGARLSAPPPSPAQIAETLGLPPPPDFADEEEAAISPAGSEAPAGPR